MSFVVQCPFCSVKAHVPDSAHGGIGKCPRGSSAFSIARPDNPDSPAKTSASPLSSSKESSVRVKAEAAAPAAPVPPETGLMQGAPQAVFDLPLAQGQHQPEAINRSWLHRWGAVSLFCAAEGLLFASFSFLTFLTIPLCVLGLLVALAGGLIDEPRNKAQASSLIAGGLLSFSLLIVAIFWPGLLGAIYYWGRQS